MKRCQASLIIREMHINTTMAYLYHTPKCYQAFATCLPQGWNSHPHWDSAWESGIDVKAIYLDSVAQQPRAVFPAPVLLAVWAWTSSTILLRVSFHTCKIEISYLPNKCVMGIHIKHWESWLLPYLLTWKRLGIYDSPHSNPCLSLRSLGIEENEFLKANESPSCLDQAYILDGSSKDPECQCPFFETHHHLPFPYTLSRGHSQAPFNLPNEDDLTKSFAFLIHLCFWLLGLLEALAKVLF